MFALMNSPVYDAFPMARSHALSPTTFFAPKRTSIFDAFDNVFDITAATRALDHAVNVTHNDDRSIQAVFPGMAHFDDISIDIDANVISIEASDAHTTATRSVTVRHVIEDGNKVTAERRDDGAVVVTVPADAVTPARKPKAIKINVRNNKEEKAQDATKAPAEGADSHVLPVNKNTGDGDGIPAPSA